MKRLALISLALTVLLPLGLFAEGAQEEGDGEQLRVVLYVNGTLGDQSFFDSANRGLERAIEEFGIMGRTVEGGWDPSNWQPDISQLAEGNWDIVIAGTWQLTEYVAEIAPQHPDKKFITYDAAVDFSAGNLDNVYSILYEQNEGSFLVGALAALMTSYGDDDRVTPGNKVVGFIGGQDIPVINDFLVGYEQGIQYIDDEVEVLTSYVGSFSDPARGKELALAQIQQGADLVFGVASESGLGVIEAAHEQDVYAIGVDSDQYQLISESDPEEARAIITSMMKNVDNSIYRAIRLHREGDLPYGEAESLGIAENGVGMARNENFDRIVPEEFVSQMDEIIEQIESGEITVDTALGN
jgi:basic membrane protein A